MFCFMEGGLLWKLMEGEGGFRIFIPYHKKAHVREGGGLFEN